MFLPLRHENPTRRFPLITLLIIGLNAAVFLFIFIRVVPIPAAFVLGFWFIVQVLNIGMGGGVAWFAHIGGFLLGIALIKALQRGRRRQAL